MKINTKKGSIFIFMIFLVTAFAVVKSSSAVLFYDDFESGDLNSWTDRKIDVSTVCITAAYKKIGSYALMASNTGSTGNKAYILKNFNSSGFCNKNTGDMYVRFYVYLPSAFLGGLGAAERVIAEILNDAGQAIRIIVSASSIYLLETKDYIEIYGPAPVADTWYCIEIKAPKLASGAVISWWINGSSAGSLSNRNFSSGFIWQALNIGLQGGTHSAESIVYYDDVIISDKYTGPVQESPSGRIEFSRPSFNIKENEGPATIGVRRRDGSTGAVSVAFATTTSSATAGVDYTAVSGTLSWSSGDTSEKTFTIPVINDALNERKEEVRIVLSSPTGGAVPGTVDKTGLMIYDDDLAGINYHVSKNGSNGDGLSWAGAWNELDQINWSAVEPGDTINIDGGTSGMMYQTALIIRKSGEAGSPITIKLSEEPGRNGKAVFFGGRTEPLPYQGQPVSEYTWVQGRTCVDLKSNSWVIMDGGKWSGITIYGGFDGIVLGMLNYFTSDCVLRNIEIYDVGHLTTTSSNTWVAAYSAGLTIGTGGSRNITLEKLLIHDNSNDVVNNGTAFNLTIRGCWFYNLRKGPDNKPFNFDSHSDGIQIYTSNMAEGVGPITVEDTIFGPGLMQGFFISVIFCNNITLKNMLFFGNNGSGNIKIDHGRYFTIENVTSYTTNEGYNKNMECYVGPYYVTDSIFRGGQNNGFPTANGGVIEGNIRWGGPGAVWMPDWTTLADPQFVLEPSTWSDITADFTAQNPVCAGKGSRITSVAKLFELYPDDDPGSAGELQFSAAVHSISENSTSAAITVSRTAGITGSVSVQYATSNGTAQAGIDYTPVSGTLSWSTGDSTNKTFTVAIINDTDLENSETINITLSNPAGGASLGTPAAAVLTITDNDMVFTDNTPPLKITAVRDGTGTDVDSTPFDSAQGSLSANWDNSSDPESSIAKYWYGIGTTPGGTDVLDWADNSTVTGVTKTGLSLTAGTTYYFTVKAENIFGLRSDPENSDGQCALISPVPNCKLTVKHQNLCPLSRGAPVKFQLSGTVGKGELRIYTITGKIVKTLALAAGINELDWNFVNELGSSIRPGIYLYTLVDSDNNRKTGKVVISR